MVVAKRGLVAPQNTFLENVIRRCNNTDCSFILANAQIVDFPIVYCNDGFSKMIGYSRAEIMQKPCNLSFMYGEHTDPQVIQRLQNAFENARPEQAELGLLKKNKTQIWLLTNTAPIKDDKSRVVLYLCQFKDITPLKQPLDDENNKVLGLSRILQIARIAKSRQQFNQIETKDLHKSSTGITSNFNQQLLSNLSLAGELLPQYRQETPKTSPHIILHYSGFKTVWDWSILALTFYTAFMVPFNIAFKNRDPPPSGFIDYVALMDSIVDVIFFADILLNFHTTFVGPGGEVVIEPSIIRRNYLKSWFVIDLLSCLPYDIFYMFKHDDERIGSLFSALKVVRLLRLGRVARKLDNYLEYGAATLLLLLCAFILVAHWYGIGEYEMRLRVLDPGRPDGWLMKLSNDLKMPFNLTASTDTKLIGGPDKAHSYISALYFTMSCMSTVGFGNIASTTFGEKCFGVFLMVISALLYAAIFGHMTGIVQQMTSSTVRYHQMISDIREFIKLQEVPRELADRVTDYVVSTWAMTKGIDTNRVLGYCPKDMKADICVHLNRKVFNEHSCFRLASDGCLRSLAMYLESNHAAPGDLLYHTGELVDALWFVVSGSLEVIQDEEVVAILGKGDVFGDEFWKNHRTGQSAANVRALTYTDLHMIKQNKLMEVLNFYKAFANSFARNLVLTYNLTNRLKFRKVVDVKREKELDERRKNEKLDISNDHPIRKLLMRMRERHGTRLVNPPVGTDIERGPGRMLPNSNSTHSITMVDETQQNAVVAIPNHRYSTQSPPRPRSPSAADRRRSMVRGKTFDEDAATRSARVREYGAASGGGSAFGQPDGQSTHGTTLLVQEAPHYRSASSQSRRERAGAGAAESLESRLANIERLLTSLHNQRTGATTTHAQTVAAGLPPPVPPPLPHAPLTPTRTAVVPPLNLSMESLTHFVDDDITIASGYDAVGRTPITSGGHLPLIHIEPESGRILPPPIPDESPPEIRRP
ncbi:PAS fold and Ion transport and Cyclic nucleotide-binding domain containing protein [Aphelenchoides fujianensis]|nr:PAS fold and Ion transport and Cyclic nucleotide-binding domain containing protein [Aphelenchoides fujianensis]